MIRVKCDYTDFDIEIQMDYKASPCDETPPRFSQDKVSSI